MEPWAIGRCRRNQRARVPSASLRTGPLHTTSPQNQTLHSQASSKLERNVFYPARTIPVRRELYAFSAHHPLPPNRSLKSAVTPISQVYQPFAGSLTLASSARVREFFFARFAAFLSGLRG